jgi:hypothetical protein
MNQRCILLIALALGFWPVSAGAQTENARPFAWDVTRAVLIDPSTFAPALIVNEAMQQDWKTSQVLFAHGWLEQNRDFTRSGLANDVPVPFHQGTRKIRRVALTVLGYSVVNNLGAAGLERLLITRYPERKTLIRTLSWVERIAFASILTYNNSARYFRQAEANRRLALEHGYTNR